MRQWWIATFIFSSLSQLSAVECSAIRSGFEVSGRAAAYIPSSHKIREIYGTAWGDYQLELSQSFLRHYSMWLGAQYTYSNGHALSCHKCPHPRTHIDYIPISLGARYNFYLGHCFNLYLGAGITYGFVYIHDHWPLVHRHLSQSGFGGIFKLGAKYYFNRHLFIETFADYRLQRFSFHKSHSLNHFVGRDHLNLDGTLLGGGIGARF